MSVTLATGNKIDESRYTIGHLSAEWIIIRLTSNFNIPFQFESNSKQVFLQEVWRFHNGKNSVYILLLSFNLLSLFWKIKIDLWDHHAVCVSVYPLLINFWMLEPIFMKPSTYIMPPEPISTAYFINPSHQSVCLYVCPPTVATQRLC
jgi:hypothetical protein